MTQPGSSGSPENTAFPESNGAFPTRRELRAQRASGRPGANATVPPVGVGASVGVGVTPDVAIAARVVVPAAAPKPTVQPTVQPTMHAPRVIHPVPRSKRKSPFKVVVALIAIPGLFLTAALPAYAFSPPNGQGETVASAAHSLATAEAQGVTVAAAAANVTVARDTFTATTKEELAQREADAKRSTSAHRRAEAARASAAEYAIYGIRAEGDDYPWPYEGTNSQGGGLSPLGYYYRECVDFVAWRLNRDAGATSGPWRWTWSSLTPGGGSAYNWANAWSNHGWATSSTPVVGAVAWFNYNHVAYVQSVAGDGSVVLEEYNWMGSHAYHTRTVPAGDVPLFLYPPA